MSIRAPLRSRQVPISPLVTLMEITPTLHKHQTHEATRWPWILPSHVQRHAAISNIPLSYRVSKKPTSLNTTSFAAPRTNLHKAANKELSLLCYQRIVSQFISCAIKSIVFGKITNSHKTRYISTIVSYLMTNPFDTYILNIYDLVWLGLMAYQPL